MISVATAVQSYCEESESQADQGPFASPAASVGRVLFVGAHDRHRRPMALALLGQGFEIMRSSTATEALSLVKKEEVTLVITGGKGSKRAGKAVLRGLRASARSAHTPVIWLGAEGDDEEALLRQGVSLFLRAPFPVEQLVSAAMFAV